MTNRYGLFGKLQAQPGRGEELSRILLEAARLLEDASGCVQYLVSKAVDEPDAVYVFEVWDSKEDHDRSLTMPAVRGLIQRAMPILQGMPSGTALEVVGGKGL